MGDEQRRDRYCKLEAGAWPGLLGSMGGAQQGNWRSEPLVEKGLHDAGERMGQRGGAEGKPAKLASQSNYEAPHTPDLGELKIFCFRNNEID